MIFADFIAQTDKTDAQIAAALGRVMRRKISSVAVFRWRQAPGSAAFQVPRYEFMRAIYRWSGGQVTPNDFYALPDLAAGALKGRSARAGNGVRRAA